MQNTRKAESKEFEVSYLKVSMIQVFGLCFKLKIKFTWSAFHLV